MKEKIVLVTSIAPKNIENQRLAMESWLNRGFKLISCNVREEIEVIEKQFPGVEFVEVERDARKIAGKPCPYLYDMLQVLKSHAGTICGIVNSDIHLRNFSEEMYDYVRGHAMDSVLFFRRQEIDRIEDAECLKSKMFFGGIDTYIFHRDIIDLIEDDGLIIGQAMWDYWFPIVLSEKGVRIRELINPLTFHVSHTFQYSNDVTVDLSWSFCQKYYKEVKKEEVIYYLNDRFLKIISPSDVQICYLPKLLQRKRVLVLGNGDMKRGMLRDMLKHQAHSEIFYMNESEYETNAELYDYIIKIPYEVEMSSVFVSVIIWIIETYGVNAVRMLLYLRGEKSNVIKIENANNTILGSFNDDVEPVVACKSEFYEKYQQGIIEPQRCQVCICSVNVDEDYEVVYARNKVSGRVLLFPAGIRAKNWLARYKHIAKDTEVIGFVDNNPKVQNSMIGDLHVYTPDILKDLNFYDRVMIITRYYTEEIYEQLLRYVPKEKIVIWDENNMFDGKRWKEKYEDALRRI